MFFFPFSDDNPTTRTPVICYILIAVCAFIFLWQFTLPKHLYESAVYSFGVVPAYVYAWKLDALNKQYGLFMDFWR